MKSVLLLIALCATPAFMYGQCTVEANAVEMTNLVCSGGTTYRSGLAFNPSYNIYYSVNSGSSGYQIETFSETGTYLASTAQGFDYRGLWWNPTLNQLDGNGYSSNGIRVHDLNATTGYPLGTGTTVIPGLNQPAAHSCGQFDPANNEIIYYNTGNIERYSRPTGAYIGATPITGLPVGTGNLNTTSIGYTGCPGMEVVIYDVVLRRVYFINLTTGAYVTTSQLPATAPTESNQRMSFSNGLFWLFDTATLTWKSYGVYQTCTPTTSSIAPSTCNSYTSPSGNYTWTTSGLYTDTVPNAVGCDSIISIDLSITPETNSTISANSCYSYTSPSGNYTWTTSGLYADTIPNAAGCDSIISIDLIINTETNSTLQASTCDTYTSPSGNYTWNSNGVYTDTIPNAQGCDSIIFIDLTVNSVNVNTSLASTVLTADATSATYQWLDCDNGYAVITGATSQSYTATINGNYAVQVTQDGCTDTSACIAVSEVGLIELYSDNGLLIYPNPSKGGVFTFDFSSGEIQQIFMVDALGKQVEVTINLETSVIDGSTLSAGNYLLVIHSDQGAFRKRLIVIN